MPDKSEPQESGNRLRQAVRSVDPPPFLQARIRHQIESQAAGRNWLRLLAPIGAASAIAAGLTIAYQLGHLRLTSGSQESYVASVSSQIGTLMRVGLGDHIHCAVFRKYPDTPPKTEEFVRAMPPEYAGLIPIVRAEVPDTYQMTLAHRCRYHGRQFIHLSLKNGSNMMSLIATRKRDGESFQVEDVLPGLVADGIPMYQSNVQRFQMTAFETRDYLVYLISDLPKDQNRSLMVALGPKVKDFLVKTEL